MPLLMGVLLFQQLLGALTFPISKAGLVHIDAFVFAFYRFLISGVILLALVALNRRTPPIERKDWPRIIGLGLIIIPFNQTLYLLGQSMTAAGHGAVLFATVPIWIYLAAIVHLGERWIWQRGIGIVVAIAGVFMIMSGGAMTIGAEYLLGDLIILIAVIAWAYYTILGKPLVRKYGALRTTAYALVAGSIVYFPFGLYLTLGFDHAAVPLSAWWTVVYVAIGTSVVAYILWYWVLKYLEASRIAVFHNLQPLIATSVAAFWLNEPLGWTFFVGGAIALGGVIFAELKFSAPRGSGNS